MIRDPNKQKFTLSAKKRAVLESLLEKQGVRAPALERIPRRPEGGPAALSFGQQSLWFLDQIEPGGAAYNMPGAVRITGPLRPDVLERALTEIVRRHEVLRTRFPAEAGEPLQDIAPPADLRLPVIDLGHLPAEGRESEARRLAREEAQRPFDLARGPLMRVSLLRLDREDHVVLFTLHHTVFDGWSMGVLLRELATLYAAFGAGRPSPLPEPPIQYADFAHWQRERLRGPVFDDQLGYWKRQLAGPLPVLDLPTDFPRSSERSPRGASASRPLPHRLGEDLRELSRREGATLFMTLLAGFQALLARYTGQDDVLVGTPVVGRTRPETEELIGFFVNTLVMRGRLDGSPTFREYLGRVRQTALQAYSHQELPFDRLVDEIQPRREAGRAPLFQTMFAVEDPPLPEVGLGGLRLGLFENDRATAKFDLTLFVLDAPEGLTARVEYDAGLFRPDTMERFLEHYEALMAGVAADPDRPVGDLPPPDDRERRVLEGFNTTAVSYPADRCVHQIFEEQAARTPDAVALVAEGLELTYAELDSRANRLAHELRCRGVGPGALVGVCAERSPELVVGLLGVLKAGSAYVPLDPLYPTSRLAFMAEDASLRLVLTQERLRPLLPDSVDTLALDADWPAVARHPDDAPAGGATPEDLAYVTYTSGSTGQPKGAAIPHRSIVGYMFGVSYVRLDPSQTFLHYSSISWDALTLELWTPLLHGARCVLYPGQLPSLEELGEVVRTAGVDILWLTSTLFNAMIDACPEALRVVRQLLVGGEALSVAHVRRALDLLPGTTLVNGYGPSECTVFTCCYPVPRPLPEGTRSVPIGRPVGDRQVYLLDARLNRVPIGVPGELYVGGAGVARGYLNRPGLTAERFVPDPFGPPGARLYRTGDRARWLPGGAVEFLGRLDDQVKVRGFRIELGEIEAALRRHPDLRGCAVVARADGGGGKRLVAYCVAAEGRSAPAARDLRAFLGATLPEYMVPAAFAFLPALPLNANGKVDRRALPGPDQIPDPGRPTFQAPRTPVEETLARVWAEVLGRERVGAHDNFFELGGDSILGIQAIARANRAGLRLTPRQLFQHQTIAELAAAAGTGPAVQAEQGPVSGPVPLTPVQHWFFAQEPPEPHHFNQALLLETRRPLDAGLLEQALGLLVLHHDALRARFRPSPAGWEQSFAAPGEAVAVTRVDLSRFPDGDRSRQLQAEATRLQAGLDLADGPIIRTALFDLGAGQPGRLMLVVHHLAIDGVSWRVLLEDLVAAYEQLRQGLPALLPPKTTSYRQWAEHLAGYARSEAVLREHDYWLAEARSRVAPLPVDRPGGAGTEGEAVTVEAELTEVETQALLREVPRACRTQITEVLLTALAQTLAAWTKAETLLLDLEGHGREEVGEEFDLSRTVGWFTAIYPVLLDLGGVREPGAALRTVKGQIRAVPQRGLGYGLLRYLAADADLAERFRALPQAEVSFNYLGQLDLALPESAPLAPAAEPAGPDRSPLAPRRYLLDVTAGVVGGRLRVAWSYSPRAHDSSTVERLADGFGAALRGLIDYSRSPEADAPGAADFPLAGLDQVQLNRLLGDDRNVEDVYPLSPMQQGLLFHALLAPGSTAYFEHIGWTVEGPLDAESFRRAWQGVLDRHAALRSDFRWEGLAEPLQVVRRQVDLPWACHDLRGLPPGARVERVEELFAEERQRPLSLGQAPLMRLALARTGEESHRCLWSYHHLLLDGWSLPLVLKEVMFAYEALRLVAEPPRELVRPYADYIAWLRRQNPARAEAFWRRNLQGFTEPTPLGIDRGPAAAAGDDFGNEELRLSEATTTALQGVARREQLTLNALLRGGWALLLSRYCGRDDVVFGATVSGRPAALPGVESTVGLFINTLPVRVRVTDDAPLSAWLQQLQADQQQLWEFEHTPLVQVQGWSELPRGTQLFDSLFVFENYPVDAALRKGPSGVEIREVQFWDHTHYPLVVLAVPGERLTLRATFDRARFDAADVARMLRHWEKLLEGMTRATTQRLADIDLLAEAERRQLLAGWNDTAAPYPIDRCLHHLVESQAALTPDALAVSGDSQRLTYRELDGRANQLARHLRGLGVGRGAVAAVGLDRSPDLIVSLLAVLKAGAAYLPLDLGSPPERLARMLAESRAAVLVTRQGLVEAPATDGLPVVRLDADGPAIARQPQENPAVLAGPRDLAYVLYTSGSTGRPKGVMIEHRSAVAFLHWAAGRFSTAELAGVLAATSACFDLSVFELFAPLSVGGTVILAGNVLDLPTLPADPPVTLVNTVPSPLSEVLADGGLPPSVRTVNLAGEPLSAELAALVYAHPQVERLYNLYGPTEATTYATEALVPREAHGPPTIGRPLANMRAYVLDHRFRPAPVGVPGELFLGGVGLARGYLHRPGLTAERFVPDPFGPELGGRLYRTGDLARRRPDGELEFLGRLDGQVKLRGFRIETGEIEAALLGHPALARAVVVARDDEPGGKRLVAYCVAAEGAAEPPVGDLRAFLGDRLPGYMVPAAFVFLPALPLTPRGKVDRKALPAPDRSAESGRTSVAPRTAEEETLAGIFAELLGRERVGVHDDFFELGGHSLLATQLISRVRKALGVEVPLRALFESKTVAGLALAVQAARAAGAAPAAPPLVPVPRTGPLPLSFAQQRLWFLDQLRPGSPAYNVHAAARLHGPLDPAAMGRALDEVVRRHESLRTTFAATDDGPVQVIAPAGPVPLPAVDLTTQSGPAREAEARRLAEEEARRPFDLARGPLLRVTLLRLAAADHVLLLTMHHIVSDGWSMGVLLHELTALYAGRPAALPPPTVQYADFAAWQRQWLQGEVLKTQLDYWRRQLANLPPALELPADRPRPAVPSSRGATRSRLLSPALAGELHALSRGEGATLFMTLMAAFQTTLYRYTGQEDVAVGTPIANRTRAETEGLIGFFVNTLVLRADLSGGPTFRELLGRVREASLGAYAHQDLPFERLVEELRPERSQSFTPLFQVLFALQNAPLPVATPAGLAVSPLETDTGTARCDLCLLAQETADGLALQAEYDTDLFDAATIDRLLGHFQVLLEGAVADPGRRLDDLPLISDEEQLQFAQWSNA